MAIKQVAALAALQEVAGQVIDKSVCSVENCWLALVETAEGRRLAVASQGESTLCKLLKEVDKAEDVNGIHVDVAKLNANNAAVIRRYVKWAAPSACGTRGTSVGFSDWLGAADAYVTDLFAKRQLKPVLVDYTPEDSAVLGRNFLEAVDTATWGVLAAGYKEGYGANAAGLKTEEDIVKALLYGYSMIGFDCSEKINLDIEKLSDEAVEKRFADFNETFQAAVNASYLNAEFKVGNSKVSFTENQLHRIILEYGEAIMHIQFIYNSYLKNTPWDIDFELYLSKPGKMLTPQEHYLIANELERNGIKLAAICLDPLNEQEALADNLQLHCDIASTFEYRLSFRNAEIGLADPAAAMKYSKGKVHFKLNNILWMSAVKLIAAKDAALYAKIAEAAGAEPVAADCICHSDACKTFALGYGKVLDPKGANLSPEIKSFLHGHSNEYADAIRENVGNYLKNL
ncbi:tagaturonate epimerase family protein [Phascolarctobacterium sp.]|uniref:tagaturonate epimerase family protein n=1 Tax=Phascolarctobacterium sp. TaxID=2049039 RepID=UPI003868FDC0